MPDNDEENVDPYEGYDEEDKKGMRAQGAQVVLDTIKQALGPDEYKQLQDQIAEGAADPLAFKPRDQWTREEWGQKWADGAIKWSAIPEAVREEMDLR